MKLILNLFTVAFIFLFIGVAFFLLINQTFFKETYVSEVMVGSGIKIERFVYFVSESDDLNARFVSLLNKDDLNKMKDNYLKDLEKCNEYYFDADNNITIVKYNIVDNEYYRDIYLDYKEGNACS